MVHAAAGIVVQKNKKEPEAAAAKQCRSLLFLKGCILTINNCKPFFTFKEQRNDFKTIS